jgi:hypothetical protein
MEDLDQDRLSSLPILILHCIMSKLPEKDAASTSVLSKAWLDTWYTFPILSFSDSKFMEKSPAPQPMENSEKMRKILGFCDYVKRNIQRFRDQRLAIKEFKLKVDCFGLEHISNDVDIWLKLACECGVEVIKYSQDVLSVGQDQYYVLPMCVIEAKSLTELVLDGFIKIDSTFMNHSIKFFSLRVLSLDRVLLGDQHAINNLISFCPLIESITLWFCSMLVSGDREKLKSLSISGLQKLKSVDVYGIQDVYIDAPSLENLCYDHYVYDAAFKIDFDRCINLKKLNTIKLTNKWFPEQFPKFLFLERLKLNSCKIPERIDISSVRLKELELLYCSNLKEVNIDAPSLWSCEYSGTIDASGPTISFSKISSQLKVSILIHVDYVHLCNLREFVLNIKPNNIFLTSLFISIDGALNDVSLNYLFDWLILFGYILIYICL